MGEAEKNRRHCFFLYKIPEEEKPKKSNAIYAIETVPKTPLPDNELELANKAVQTDKYVQSIYVADDNDEMYKQMDPKDNQLSLHGSIAQLPRQINDAPAKHVTDNVIHHFFSHQYAPFILKDGVRMLASISYVVYLVIAIFGCLNFKEGLEPKNLVTASHYISHYFEDIKMFWKIGPQLHVAVLTPPDFKDPIQR